MKLTREMEPGSTLHVITSDKHAKSLRSNIEDSICNKMDRAPPVLRDCGFNDAYIRIRGVNLDIDAVHTEEDLMKCLLTKFERETRDDDPETSVLEIDMSCATPWESVAVCKLSAAINVRMYTSRGGYNHITSFPKHLDLDESELAVLRHFRGGKNFTRDDVIEVLRQEGFPASGTTAQRVIKSLDMDGKRCIIELTGNDYPGERSNHGGNRVKYYRVVDESWMMERINHRCAQNLDESISCPLPGDKNQKIPGNNDFNP